MTDAEKENYTATKALVKNGSNNGKKINNKLAESASNASLNRQIRELKRYVLGLFILLVAAALILIITFSVLFANLKWDLQNHDHPPKIGAQMSKILEEEELCLVCDEVRLGPSMQEDRALDYFVRKPATANKKEECCIETPAQLMKYLQMFVQRKYREELAHGHIKVDVSTSTAPGEQRPSAHLMGYPQNKNNVPYIPGRLIEISEWVSNTDLAFTNKVQYRHGRIVILEAGLYYVYSQLSFLERLDDPSSVSTSQSLSHYIYRYNIIYPNGGEEQMVQSSFTKCSGENKRVGEYTSYLGSVFYLRQGDEVFVKVSDLTLVVWEPKQNYFGLFKVN